MGGREARVVAALGLAGSQALKDARPRLGNWEVLKTNRILPGGVTDVVCILAS